MGKCSAGDAGLEGRETKGRKAGKGWNARVKQYWVVALGTGRTFFQRKDHGVEPCASAGGHITLPMVVDKKKPVWVVGRSGAMVVAHTASGCR